MNSLNCLLKPTSICVYGVSKDQNKLGSVIYNNILLNGFKGKLYPINPKYSTLGNSICYPDANSIPDPVELAVIATPAHTVPQILDDAGRKGVKAAIIISAGFSETGDIGKALEEELKVISLKYSIALLGPNCLGLINTESNLNASFAQFYPAKGNIAFVSQSGAFGTALLDFAAKKNLGISQFVSVGNMSGIDEINFIEEWLKDDSIKVIAAYIEEFGRGLELVEVIKNSKVKKPIIILHPGSSIEARSAIASHTGSIASAYSTASVALKSAGVIEVKSIEDMFNYLLTFSWGNSNKLSDKSITILTNAGGPGIMITDLISEKGIKLTKLTDQTVTSLTNVLPEESSKHNPIDLIGDASSKRYKDALDILSSSNEVNNIIAILTPQAVTEVEETSKTITNFSKSTTKNIFPLFLGGEYIQVALDRFKSSKVPFFKYDEDCVDAINAYLNYYFESESDISSQESNLSLNEIINLNKSKILSKISLEVTVEQTSLSEQKVMELAKQFNITTPLSIVIHSIEELVEAIKSNSLLTDQGKLSKKLVLKATTKSLVHKTDAKAVFLNIETTDELKKSYLELITNINTANKDSSASGNPEVLLQEMLSYPLELFLGINRDGGSNVYESRTGFGHILVFGMGGIYTEIMKDFSMGLVPMNRIEILKLISNTKVSEIIDGARGQKALAKESLVDLITKLQSMVLVYPEISSIDINPVMINDINVICADFKIFVKK
ncbi:MAG: acetate--CoA ligase family protein [bacterium]